LGVERGFADFEIEEVAIAMFRVSQCGTRSGDALGSPFKVHLDPLAELDRILAQPQNGRNVVMPILPEIVNGRVARDTVTRETGVVDSRAGAHVDKINGRGQ
jgi:hypothetical protein